MLRHADDDEPDTVTLLARTLPAWLERQVLTLVSGERRLLTHEDWPDSFVVVEHGSVELEDTAGRCAHLEEGASFCPPPGALAVTAVGPGRAVLAGVRRCGSKEGLTGARRRQVRS